MIMVIIGPSGSGKGTQAELLSKKLRIPAISMGNLFRRAYEEKTPAGIRAETYWGKGRWVPDSLTFKILKPALDQCKNGFIVDGFPRTFAQIPILEEYLSRRHLRIDRVINLKISDKESIKRLLLRARRDKETKGKARSDETAEKIKNRLQEYCRTATPILEHFQKKGILLEINGERPIEEIHHKIMEKLQ